MEPATGVMAHIAVGEVHPQDIIKSLRGPRNTVARVSRDLAAELDVASALQYEPAAAVID